MRSRRFSRRSFQKKVVNGVRVDAAYLKEQKEMVEAVAEALEQKRIAVRRRKPKPPTHPKPAPEPVVEVVEEVPEPEAEKAPEVVVEDTGDVQEDE